MTATDELTVAAAICAADTDDDYWETLTFRVTNDPEWHVYQREIDRYLALARAAIAAMQPSDSLGDVLNASDTQRIILYRMRYTSPHRWSAAVQARHCTREDPQGIAVDTDPVEAIRGAVANANGETT